MLAVLMSLSLVMVACGGDDEAEETSSSSSSSSSAAKEEVKILEKRNLPVLARVDSSQWTVQKLS